MFFYIIIIIYISLLIYYNYHLKKFDKDAYLIVKEKRINDKYPLIDTLNIDFDFKNFLNTNINYFLIDNNNYIDLSNLKNDKLNFTVHKNYKLYNDLFKNLINYDLFNIKNLINYESICIYKGNTLQKLTKTSSKDNIIYQIYGTSTIYIFNPKNKDNIINKNKNDILKWGESYQLNQFDYINIPCEWFYILISDDISILYINDSNDLFTIYNYYFNI